MWQAGRMAAERAKAKQQYLEQQQQQQQQQHAPRGQGGFRGRGGPPNRGRGGSPAWGNSSRGGNNYRGGNNGYNGSNGWQGEQGEHRGGRGEHRGGQRGGQGEPRGDFRGRGRGHNQGQHQQNREETPQEHNEPPPMPKKPWLTSSLYNHFRTRNELQRAARSSHKAEDFAAFQAQRAVCVKEESRLRNDYLTQFPEKESFWLPLLARETLEQPRHCEICEEDFENEAGLVEHEEQHEECGMEGCTFMASAEVVHEHIVSLHATGLYARMCLGYQKEEVKQWRAERKSNWPSTKTTELAATKKENKQLLMAEKERRRLEEVEVRQADYSEVRVIVNTEARKERELWQAEFPDSNPADTEEARFKRNKRAEKRKLKNKFVREGRKKQAAGGREWKAKDKDDAGQSESEDEDVCCGVKRFRGIASDTEGGEESEAEMPSENEKEEVRVIQKQTVKPCSSSQAAVPVHAAPVQVVPGQAAPVHAAPVQADPIEAAPVQEQEDDDDSPPVEVKTVKPAPTPEQQPEVLVPPPPANPIAFRPPPNPDTGGRIRMLMRRRALFTVLGGVGGGRGGGSSCGGGRTRATLLERLLDGEIRRERLELLQCVKYVVENEFFRKRRNDNCDKNK